MKFPSDNIARLLRGEFMIVAFFCLEIGSTLNNLDLQKKKKKKKKILLPLHNLFGDFSFMTQFVWPK